MTNQSKIQEMSGTVLTSSLVGKACLSAHIHEHLWQKIIDIDAVSNG